ncbi:MAG: His/Gly/Thr/Pro-type tRNA ligase C-terminal domain-containing protein, partial [Promethearchaeota archaeon]
PIQVRIVVVSNNQNKYAEEILEEINAKGYRADFDDREEKIGKKIRQAEVEWIPYVIVIGNREQDNDTISVRKRLIGQKFVINPRNQQKETFEGFFYN